VYNDPVQKKGPPPDARTGTLVGLGAAEDAATQESGQRAPLGTLLGVAPAAAPATEAAPSAAAFGQSHWVLERAAHLDGLLSGKRTVALLAVSLIAAVASLLEWYFDRTPLLTLLTTFALIAALEVVGLARLGALRDQAGQWSLTLAVQRCREEAAATAARKPQLAAASLLGAAMAILVARNLAVAAARSASLLGFDGAAAMERATGAAIFASAAAWLAGAVLWVVVARKLPAR
jgi:hypothetical protein